MTHLSLQNDAPSSHSIELGNSLQREMEQVFLAENPEGVVTKSHFGIRNVPIPAADNQGKDSKKNLKKFGLKALGAKKLEILFNNLLF